MSVCVAAVPVRGTLVDRTKYRSCRPLGEPVERNCLCTFFKGMLRVTSHGEHLSYTKRWSRRDEGVSYWFFNLCVFLPPRTLCTAQGACWCCPKDSFTAAWLLQMRKLDNESVVSVNVLWAVAYPMHAAFAFGHFEASTWTLLMSRVWPKDTHSIIRMS